MLSNAEQRALRSFRDYEVTPGQMLCFFGPNLQKHKAALKTLADKNFLIQEQFRGGYSLTDTGFKAMQEC